MKYVICYSSDKYLIYYYNSGAPKIVFPDMTPVLRLEIYIW
ncbi:hypothetical protein XBFM1_820095 [Xenorhabdus bovienii str. feltiae Moldova]|uniref:Uncharacterized protein n=1 Tax=Xenorhabdus bovienii str. feltiae Moldova TaxID=1398200 RepID=A0A077NY36_XENBV|nr:hypothetical protein XBFM1_820095 [Xenorhabdus bovienii str. feltiae Moldova]